MHFMQTTALGRVLAAAALALLATTSLSAIPRDPCEPIAPPVCCEEPKPGPFAFAYPFDLELNCPRDFYVHVDGLAMQAKQDGMEFVIQNSSATDGTTLSQGTVEGFSSNANSWDYNPGMRFGLGFYLDHDAWQLDFNWTWINVTNYQLANTTTSGGHLIPLWLDGSGMSSANFGFRSSAVWRADYNTFDISLGKPYYVSRYLIFNPHFGIRGGWIDQHFSVSYGETTPGNRVIAHGDNNFWGVGARAGLDTDWVLGKGWCLFGNFAASLLCGKFEISQNFNIINTDNVVVDHKYYQNTPNFEIVLGIGWGKYFNKKRNHVALRAAYEFHEWFDQLNMRKFFTGSHHYANDTVSRGNFTLNGFSLKLQFDI